MTDPSTSQSGKNLSWPGGKPIAVLVSILFETWRRGDDDLSYARRFFA